MKNLIRNPFIAMATSLLTFVSLSASADTYSPATFGFSGQDLTEKMATVTTGNHVIYCRSDISAAGDASKSRCFGKTVSISTLYTAVRALDQIAFTPAKVEGLSVPVRMSYRIAFSEKDGLVSANMLPNLGTMSAKFGNHYSAPQERLDTGDWYANYSEKSRDSATPFFGLGENARIAAEVGAHGKATRSGVVEAKRSSLRDSKLAAKALKDAKFIPGMVDGKEVKMDYVVGLNHNNENHSLAAN